MTGSDISAFTADLSRALRFVGAGAVLTNATPPHAVQTGER
jgi:hypothetical protein